MIILIPAYEPDELLLTLITELTAAHQVVLVVDDGSGPAYAPLFRQARARGATVIGYANNLGKGQALKTGFHYLATHHPGQDVVCADSDGQHRVPDILRVAQAVTTHRCMVLGERRFDGRVPLRSRLGNGATRLVFGLATGSWLQDTQTGLRGYPASLLPWLALVDGDRYEYELNLLLAARTERLPVESVTIATVYLANNAGSHFRPVRDSLRIYAPLLTFSLSSLAGYLVDVLVFLLLTATSGSLLVAVVGARLVSAGVNFTLNHTLVFRRERTLPWRQSALRYLALAAGLLAANYCLLLVLTGAGMPVLLAKVLTEAGLFLASFTVQQRFLFHGRTPSAVMNPAPTAAPPPSAQHSHG